MSYIRFYDRTINKEDDDPACFGIGWSSTDRVCKYECEAFGRCGREKARMDALRASYSKRTDSSDRTQPNVPDITFAPVSESGTVGTYTAPGSIVIRPQRPEGYPPGTEYLPPVRAGQSSWVERAAAIAFAEGTAAGMSQLFSSLADFSRDITAWHPNAGRWRYGENWKKVR